MGGGACASTALYSGVVSTGSMMQSYASGAKLLGAAPFFSSARRHRWRRGAPPRIVIGQPILLRGGTPKLGFGSNAFILEQRPMSPGSCGRAQDGALGQLAIGHVAPERDQELARQSDDHGLADVAFGAGHALEKPARQRALLLEHGPAPGQLQHSFAHPPIAGSRQPLLASPGAALVGRSGEAAIARHGPP